MEDRKHWWESKTVWGAVVTLVSAGSGLGGIIVEPGEQATLVDFLASAGAALGGLLALTGRLVAKSRIG